MTTRHLRLFLLLIFATLALPAAALAEDEAKAPAKKDAKKKKPQKPDAKQDAQDAQDGAAKDGAAKKGDTGDDEAESGDEEELAGKHFARGRKLYGEGKYQEAIAALLKAYNLRPAPPILLNIARTYEKLNDKKNALKFYKEFLQKARLVDPNRAPVEAVVKELEKQAGKTGALTTASGTDAPTAQQTTDEGQTPAGKQQLIHTPVDSARVNQPITVLCELPPQVTIAAVLLHFRRSGEQSFQNVKMEVQGESYVARIPASAVTSSSLQYYLEAYQTVAGKHVIVALAGAKKNPHIIVIEGGHAAPIGPVKEETLRSPHFKWAIAASATTAAFLGVALTGLLMAKDRQSAMETRAIDPRNCDAVCQTGTGNAVPKQRFDLQARDWESQGKTWAAVGKAFLVLGIVAGGAAGYFWYADRAWIKAERRKKTFGAAAPRGPRFVAAPYAGVGGAGVWGQLEF